MTAKPNRIKRLEHRLEAAELLLARYEALERKETAGRHVAVALCSICGNPRDTGRNGFGTHQCPPPGH